MAVPSRIRGWLEGVRFPILLLLTAVLFVANLLIPDPLPFVDEILLAMITLVLARLRRKPKSNPETPAGTTAEEADP